ncbi:MAG TPA: hypothetical protein VNM72_00435 [Blastocatellia bacterium]|nr:hypothetical protein [Blastocatellia bacterium]
MSTQINEQKPTKQPEPDDPMELVMVPVPGGNPELMATCIVEEYALLGMGEEEIFRLFRSPLYRTHAFYLSYGEAWVRTLIRRVLQRTGRFRVRIVESQQPDDREDNLRILKPGIPSRRSHEGGNHG